MSPLIRLDFTSPPEEPRPEQASSPKEEQMVEDLMFISKLSFVEEVKENATSYHSRNP